MSTLFEFQARDIVTRRPEWLNWSSDIPIDFTLVKDPISDAVNNVRFGCKGIAGTEVFFTLRTYHLFVFPPVEGRLKAAHAHFMPQGAVSINARKQLWWLDIPGYAFFGLWMKMYMSVYRTEGQNTGTRFGASTAFSPIFTLEAQAAGSTSVSREAVVESDLLQFTQSLSLDLEVIPADQIQVVGYYQIRGYLADDGEFVLDFGSLPGEPSYPGDGLNCPMAVINVD